MTSEAMAQNGCGGGDITIRFDGDRWLLGVNQRRPVVCRTLDEALRRAGRVTFEAGEAPGAWRVKIR